MRNVLIQNIYPLTPMQEGLLYHSILDERSEAYFDQTIITLNERLDPTLLEQSFQALIDRYEVLRTVFVYKEVERPVQVVLTQKRASVGYEDISGLTENEQRLVVEEFATRERKKRFNLEKDLLIRLSVFQLSESKCKLILSFHHIIMDGWCIGTVAKDLFQIYRAYLGNVSPELDPVFPYSRYIHWLEKQNKEEALTYWKTQLADVEQQSALPVGVKPAGDGGYVLENRIFKLNQDLTRRLEKIAQQNQVTLSTVFHVIWGLLLQRYNNTRDVVFGSVVSGRPAEVEGAEHMVGLFINTVPVRLRSEDGQSFSALVKQFQQMMMDASKYHYVSLADIQAQTPLKTGLIHHIVAFENYPLAAELFGGEGQQLVSIIETEGFEQTNYDFNIGVIPGEELQIKFGYNALVYRSPDIGRLELHLKRIAEQIASDPHRNVDHMEMLENEEKQTIVHEFNDTAASYPQDKLIQQLFEEQAERTPDRLAAMFTDREMTYMELNEQTNRLARVLRDAGIGPNRIVGIAAYRSPEMLIGIMAILKAGGAYLPINPEDPEERIRYVAANSGASIVLTQRKALNKLEGLVPGINVLVIGEPLPDYGAAPLPVNGPDDLAYVIYTSGSTGKPKGVMIRHASVMNRLYWMQKRYPLGPEDIILQKTPYTFDVSVWEMFWWFMAGASVCFLPPGGEKDPGLMIKTIEEKGITTLHFVPSMLSVFLEYAEQYEAAGKLHSMKRIFASGETLTVAHVRRFNRLLRQTNGTALYNLYGPTEATVDVTYFDCPGEEEQEVVPIGKPIDNTRLYILDRLGRLMPVGVPGELHIAGLGVAKGYVNRPDLTEEKFVPDPFVPGGRMYKTGDLSRWMPDGNIEYLGRIDHQVKIRGYRIETGEIEAALLSHEGVREVVVVTKEDGSGQPYLCAYFVADAALAAQAIRTHLKASLPDYMVPAHLMQLDSLPLSPNGKVDRRVLPEPDGRPQGNEYVPPRTETEGRLVQLWETILNLHPIGIYSNFFEVGGHSLKATLLIAKISREFQVELPMRDIFDHPTVESMSRLIERALGVEAATFSAISPVEGRDHYPVSSAQKRQMILHQLEGAELVYNMPSAMLVQGRIDCERLERTFEELIRRHEALRTSFTWMDGEPVQSIRSKVDFQLHYDEITGCAGPEEVRIEAALHEFVRPFDLGKTPLFRAKLVRLSETRHILLVDMHHIISDGVSVSVIMDEFGKLYDGHLLAPLTIQYKDYANWHNEQLDKGFIREQESYWLHVLAGDLPVLQLPTDFPRPPVQSFEGDTVSRILDQDITGKLQQLAAETKSTLFMILLAVYNVVLSKYARQEDIIVGSPVAGRRHPDAQQIVGMFVNTLALRNYPTSNKTFKAFLAEVKENTLAAFEHQEYPFEQLVEKLALRRDVSRSPLFDTMLVLQNASGNPMRIDGAEFKTFPLNPGVSRFDLTFNAAEADGCLQLHMEYSSRLFRHDTVERMMGHFVQALKSFADHSEQKIGDVDMVTAEEKEAILSGFNGTKARYPKEKTVHQLFEEQVERTPDHPAAIFEGQRLTYRELNARANRLARVLRSKGVG
ncbi:amino acid adenylation domain-containing protein, partial [Paenibacillus elgii]